MRLHRERNSPQTGYVIFRSKAGILAELLDTNSFGTGYQNLIRQAKKKEFAPDRLRFAARIETMDLLQGVSLVTAELADLIKNGECHRYDSQKSMVDLFEVKLLALRVHLARLHLKFLAK